VSFVTSLFNLESGGQNIANTTTGTSSGQAQGYFQITTGTWNDFAPKAGVDLGQYPTPLSAPLAVQSQVAGTIPLGRWAQSTLDNLTAAGYSVDPSATLAQNAANNGDNFFAAPNLAGATGPELAAAAGTPAGQAAAGPGVLGAITNALGLSGPNGLVADIENWFTRGFLIVVGLIVLAFGLWHLMGAPGAGQLATALKGARDNGP
jgi:hypothetical protein